MLAGRRIMRAGTRFGILSRSVGFTQLKISPFKRFQSSKPHSSSSDEKYWMIGGAALLVSGMVFLTQMSSGHSDHSHEKNSNDERLSSPKQASQEIASLKETVEEVPPSSVSQDSEPSGEAVVEKIVTTEATPLPETNIQSQESLPKDELDSIVKPPTDAKETTPGKKAKLYYKYILVGGGTASYSAMQAIKLKDPSADVLIVSEEPFTPYMRPPLSKELWFSEKEDVASTLSFKDWQGSERNLIYGIAETFENIDPSTLLASSDSRTKIITGCAVQKLDVDRKVLHLSNGQRVAYDKILLATGGTPKTLDLVQKLPTDVQAKVTNYRNLADYRALESLVKEGKSVAVIGGGFLGSELAFALTQRGRRSGTQITQIYPESGNMAAVFPPYLTEWTSERMKEEGVKIHSKSSITNISLNDAGKLNIELNKENVVSVDHVVVAIGITPNDKLARESGLEIDSQRGGILVNAELESRGGVFAAGDVTSYHDIALGRRRVEHHDHAALSGRHAGENMVGPKKPYRHQSMFWSDLGPKIGYEAVGLVDSSLKTSSMWIKDEASESEKFNKGLVFYFKEQKLVGVMLWNLFGKVDVARSLIRLNKFGPEHVNELAAQFSLYDSAEH